MAELGSLTDWPVAALAQALQPLGEGARVVVRAEEDSTNATLLQWGREGERRPCLLVAEHQRAGRGRAGRAWQSAAGDSLTFSLGLALEPADWSGLSLAVGLALAEALDPPGTSGVAAGPDTGRPRLMLKWPNDLWLAGGCGAEDRRGGAGAVGAAEAAEAVGAAETGRKLGGILIETCGVAGSRWCVIGVGLNIRPHRFEGLGTGYACLQELDYQASAPAALLRMAGPLATAVARFAAAGFAPLQPAYARRDLLRGREVSTGGAAPLRGLALGVDAGGVLRIRDASGQEHGVVAGEVSVRPTGRVVPPAGNPAAGAAALERGFVSVDLTSSERTTCASC